MTFEADRATGDQFLTATFTADEGTGGPVTRWELTPGDGNPNSVPVTGSPITYTYTAPGTYTVTMTGSNETGSDAQVRTGYVTVGSGTTVARTSFNAVETAATGKTLTHVPLYSSGTTRNVDLWTAAYNWTCRTYSGGNGVLITARHVLHATHAPLDSSITFVNAAGATVTRTVQSTQVVNSWLGSINADLSVATLTADATGITPATLVPSDLADYWNPAIEAHTPGIILPSQERHCHSVVFTARNEWRPASGYNPQSDGLAYQAGDGDSGSPVFLLLDGVPVLVSHCYFANKGPDYAAMIASLEIIVAAAGLSLTVKSLSGYTTLPGGS